MVERVSCVSDGSVNRTFFSLFLELEDLVGNLIIGLFAIGFFEELFLKLLQSFVNAISVFLLSTTDHLCDVLLELGMVRLVVSCPTPSTGDEWRI